MNSYVYSYMDLDVDSDVYSDMDSDVDSDLDSDIDSDPNTNIDSDPDSNADSDPDLDCSTVLSVCQTSNEYNVVIKWHVCRDAFRSAGV